MKDLIKHEYFIKKALEEAHKAADKGEVPVGAVIVIDNKIIARAHNLTQTLNDVTAHAEIMAITSASNFLMNCAGIVVVRASSPKKLLFTPSDTL